MDRKEMQLARIFGEVTLVNPNNVLFVKAEEKEQELAKEYWEFDPATKEIEPIEKEKALETARGVLSRVDKWKVFKGLASTVASGCASAVIVKCAENAMPENMTLAEKVISKIGLYFISGLVSAKVSEQVEGDLEEWKELVMSSVEQEKEKEEGAANGGEEA